MWVEGFGFLIMNVQVLDKLHLYSGEELSDDSCEELEQLIC